MEEIWATTHRGDEREPSSYWVSINICKHSFHIKQRTLHQETLKQASLTASEVVEQDLCPICHSTCRPSSCCRIRGKRVRYITCRGMYLMKGSWIMIAERKCRHRPFVSGRTITFLRRFQPIMLRCHFTRYQIRYWDSLLLWSQK